MSKFCSCTMIASFTLSALLLGCGQAKQDAPEISEAMLTTATTPVSLPTVTLAVSGMSCQFGCMPRAEAALTKTPGVESAKIDFAKKEATVKLKGDTSKFDSNTLIDSLKTAGFDGKLLN